MESDYHVQAAAPVTFNPDLTPDHNTIPLTPHSLPHIHLPAVGEAFDPQAFTS